MCTSQRASKTLCFVLTFPVLHPSQLELWEEAETVWRKDMRGKGGGKRRKQPSVKKISPQFQGQLRADWPQAE